MRHRLSGILLLMAMTLQATGCAQDVMFEPPVVAPPRVAQITQSELLLKSLPPPRMPTVVSVYDFQDQTGQLKPNTTFAEYSRAVTQGGLSILVNALMDAGNGRWFTVVERGGLKDLLEERQIINTMRQNYATPDNVKLGKLPPLLYGGMLIEGAIVGYDSNIVTGGVGANYLGIGGNVSHQRDIVTVDLRAVSVANGQVMLSVSSEKTIYSTSVQGNVFKFVSLDHLLEAETGFTTNEPPQLAVRQAIETGVYELIMEGARRGLWQFADPAAGRAALTLYMKRINNQIATRLIPAPLKPVPATTQLPTSATQTELPTGSQGQAEKKAIVGQTNDFLSFGSGETPPANNTNTPNQYPPVPLPAQNIHH